MYVCVFVYSLEGRNTIEPTSCLDLTTTTTTTSLFLWNSIAFVRLYVCLEISVL